MNEKIKEMALIMCEREDCKTCTHFIDATKCAAVVSAKKLYNAGYRKQREGEWIKINPNNLLVGEYYCSCCNDVIDIADGRETPLDRQMYFCPNCGAKMKGAGNG